MNNTPQHPPQADVLEEGWLHKLMLLFDKPENWPLGGLLLAQVLGASLCAVAWFLFMGDWRMATAVAIIQLAFLLSDSHLFHLLPRRGLSFGPWKAQSVVLAIPRLAITLLVAPLTLWLGNWTAVGLFYALQMAGTLLLLYATTIEPFRLRLTELTIITDRLPADAPPIRLLHITDLHVERLTKRETAVVTLAQQANPDLILISGDYVNLSYNKDPLTHQHVRDLLGQFHAPHGVYATLGSGPVDLRDQVVPLFDNLPITLLRHDWQTIKLDTQREFVLLGMDCTHHLPTDRAQLAHLHAIAPNSAPQILLYHSPELMPEAAQHGIDLYLCGHTHGGQVRLPLVGPLLTSSQLGRRYVMGLYKEARTHLYVSRGIGLEGLSAPRVRFLSPPEMTLVTLRGSSKSKS